MGRAGGKNASIQAYLTPATSPAKFATHRPEVPYGDGFTEEELQGALRPKPVEAWHPEFEYADREISDLTPGPNAITFMGRVANIFDVTNAPQSPKSAKGCLKLVVKDGGGAITVRLWYASHIPCVRLGSLVSIWTNHGMMTVSTSIRIHPLLTTILSQQWREWILIKCECATLRLDLPRA